MGRLNGKWEHREWGMAYRAAISQLDSAELQSRLGAAKRAIRLRLHELASSRDKDRVEELAALYEASTMLEVLQKKPRRRRTAQEQKTA